MEGELSDNEVYMLDEFFYDGVQTFVFIIPAKDEVHVEPHNGKEKQIIYTTDSEPDYKLSKLINGEYDDDLAKSITAHIASELI